MSKSPKTYSTQDALDADVEYWQKRLRVQDWDLDVKVSLAPEEFDGSTAWCTRAIEHKIARIRLKADAIQRSDALETDRDQEISLVHELLHMPMEEFCDIIYDENEALSDRTKLGKERMLNMVANALVTLRREIK